MLEVPGFEEAKTFRFTEREKLERRAIRLVGLLTKNAPTQIIAGEIALIVEAGLGYCGPEVLEKFGSLLVGRMFFAAGICSECGKNEHLPGCVLCVECFNRMEEKIDKNDNGVL